MAAISRIRVARIYKILFNQLLAFKNMAFSEQLKFSIRKRAHFRCCICRSVGVEIHHIIPQEESGADVEENAAPLCPSCHEIYGANPTKRKFIREARDFWFELCDSQAAQPGLTSDDLALALNHVATKSDLDEIKTLLAKLVVHGNIVTGNDKLDERKPVPIEYFIRSLYEEDFDDKPDVYDLLFDSRAWYEEGDDSYELLDRRAFFLKQFGEQTARRICLVACKHANFDPNGFTEEQLGDVLGAVHAMVILITLHKKFAGEGEVFVECARRPDGEFLWWSGEKPAKRKTSKKGTKKR